LAQGIQEFVNATVVLERRRRLAQPDTAWVYADLS